MATDMSKGLPALGHKIYLQYLVSRDPKIVTLNLGKHAVLRNSYQNRQNIGLSILWVLGLAGTRDFVVGLKVFQEVMLPLLEMKNYTKFVTKYLVKVVRQHESVCLTREQYFAVSDVIFSQKKNFPGDLAKELNGLLPALRKMLFGKGSGEKFHTFVDPFLKRVQGSSNQGQREEFCRIIVSCLVEDKMGFGSWAKCYVKYLVGSACLLNFIGMFLLGFPHEILRYLSPTFSYFPTFFK